MASITLRYFNCRGRAQPLRYYLEHAGVSFQDERVPFTDGWQTWSRMKRNSAISGPFGKLPVLVWDGRLYSETALISSFLQGKLDPPPNAPLVDQAQSALLDDLARLYELLNLDIVAPGADLRSVSQRIESGLASSFDRYETVSAGPENPFLLSSGPSIAAFWLNEVFQMAQSLLGTRATALVDRLPALAEILQGVSSLPAVRCPRNVLPPFWSARPDEPERLVLLRPLLE